MGTVYQILAILLVGLAIFLIYRTIKNQPQLFTKQNFTKTASTMGFLALFLIVLVAFLVVMVNN
jgi:hypothetical protein